MMKKRYLLIFTIGLYLITRLINLTALPIFADEAIYIRWATMIFHNPHQFLFLPMYDGKPPLFIWLLIPFVKLFPDNPLLGARLLSTLFGLGTFFAIRRIVKQLGGTSLAQLIANALIIFLPYPLFHDRMGLIDSATTTWLAWCFYYYLLWQTKRDWKSILTTGFFWGVALMTKTTAFYFAPVLAVLFIFDLWKHPIHRNFKVIFQAFIAILIGLICLGWMRVSPLFPFLFQRSSDFAFSLTDILTKPTTILQLNLPRIARWLWTYFTSSLWLIVSLGLIIIKKNRSTILLLLLCTGVFVLPFLVTGKLLASRYILPSIIFVVPATAFALESLLTKRWWLGWTMVGLLLVAILRFAIPLWTYPGSIPFTTDDVHQYLSEWSAGYGIPEIRDYLRQQVNSGRRVLVGTEGYFGTLPDGLFVYFSATPLLKNMEIIGVGQPIVDTPKELLSKADLYDETYLVVNQNRLKYDYVPAFDLVGSYAKPHGGAPLLLLRLKQ